MNSQEFLNKYRQNLLSVRKPAQYIGGEVGSISRDLDEPFKVAVSFPDLYEIGMSNRAIKIIYDSLNQIEDVQCERVFAPLPDFEEVLRNEQITYFTLENHISLNKLNILAFSFSYELLYTNLLNILDLGGIPLSRRERDDTMPIIMAGGPGMTNPAPMHDVLDAVYIGESEEFFSSIVNELKEMVLSGQNRTKQLEYLNSQDYIWTPDKTNLVQKAVYSGFSHTLHLWKNFPLPTMNIVQDHGVVEIMRGCPNKCRFCHAGIFYRPVREKDPSIIIKEVEQLIEEMGYKEVTLSSLSSGDYSQIFPLLQFLNRKYQRRGVSFQIPSLRVSSVSLPLMSELSKVKKSGLTFAIETPLNDWQRSLNKEVPEEKVIELLLQAKELGWRLAKFYFMFGLPYTGDVSELDKISEYLRNIQRKTAMNLNVNIGLFIPKAHTPYQWSGQLKDEEAFEAIKDLKRNINNKRIKISYQSTFTSYLEGIFSRGDKVSGDIFMEAFRKGARLDAWHEYNNRDLWRSVLESYSEYLENLFQEKKQYDEELPWDNIELGVSKKYLWKENIHANERTLSPVCTIPCKDNCGVCHATPMVKQSSETLDAMLAEQKEIQEQETIQYPVKSIFHVSLQKKLSSVFLGHLDLLHAVEGAINRTSLHLLYSQGFNPKPLIEFANPLALGFASDNEIIHLEFDESFGEITVDDLTNELNSQLAEGLEINKAVKIDSESWTKRRKITRRFWGAVYHMDCTCLEDDEINTVLDNINLSVKDRGLESFYTLKKMKDYIEIKVQDDNNPLKFLKLLKELYGANALSQLPLITRKVSLFKSLENEDVVEPLV